MPDQSYRQALDWLVATGSRGERLGLERTVALFEAAGNPQQGLRGVLVAGTNGKGSTCAMVEAACRAAGLHTALLTKPHLASYRERIAVDGAPVSRERFSALVAAVQPAVAAVESGPVGAPTQFEILTLLGILAAAQADVDVVVCEVGLGGRLDSTNILDLGVCAITQIALDHRERLGDTLEEIAAEKAGILEPGDDLVTAARGTALEVVRDRAAAVGVARLGVVGEDVEVAAEELGLEGVRVRVGIDGWEVTARVPLPGAFQAENAAVAVAACRMLADRGLALGPEAVAAGLEGVRWRGRLQWLPGTPALLVDSAHNPAAVEAIVPPVLAIADGRPLVVVAGCMVDKDVPAILEALRPLGAPPVFTQAATPRAAPAVELARLWGPGARAVADLPDALGTARLLAGGDGVVLVCGSVYLAGDVLRLVDSGMRE